MYYLTFNDAPSGVYFGQVTDVCRFMNDSLNEPVKLISFISIRNFRENRQKILANYPDSLVIPMFPKPQNWRMNIPVLFILLLLMKKSSIIARGPFATIMSLKMRKAGIVTRVCYDGRGAYSGELMEYDVVASDKLKSEIKDLEKQSVLESDFRIAVSNKLVQYWSEWFGYHESEHVVIPCTFNSSYKFKLPDHIALQEKRKMLGFNDDDIVLVYSGSVAGWQSLEGVDAFLIGVMKDPSVKVIFLADLDLENLNSYKTYKDRITKKWLKPSEVHDHLLVCDYGIMLRERSVTNKVASPTKFAEYLVAGLKVLISDELGDFSDFVREHKCGQVVDDPASLRLYRQDHSEKERLFSLAFRYFSKDSYRSSYQSLIKALAC